MVKIIRLINTKAHATADYLLGLVMLAAPWTFGFSSHKQATLVALLYGTFIALLALFTKFEYALVKLVPLKLHFRIDFLAGMFLATSPWLFRHYPEVFKPQLVFGLTQMAMAVLSDRVLYRVYRRSIERGAPLNGSDYKSGKNNNESNV